MPNGPDAISRLVLISERLATIEAKINQMDSSIEAIEHSIESLQSFRWKALGGLVAATSIGGTVGVLVGLFTNVLSIILG